MKMTRTYILLLFVYTTMIYAQEKASVKLTVIIENISSDQGNILASVHNRETFFYQKPPYWDKQPAKTGEQQFKFEVMPHTAYALMLLHDTNENYRMDFSKEGHPAEDAAISGKPNRYGPPQFEEAKFVLEKDSIIRLRF